MISSRKLNIGVVDAQPPPPVTTVGDKKEISPTKGPSIQEIKKKLTVKHILSDEERCSISSIKYLRLLGEELRNPPKKKPNELTP